VAAGAYPFQPPPLRPPPQSLRPRLSPLFSGAAPSPASLQDAESNARLDSSLESYLRLLSAYFLLPAATRTLEFLIRRFKCGVCTAASPRHARRVRAC
jgi:hypothetical protein